MKLNACIGQFVSISLVFTPPRSVNEAMPSLISLSGDPERCFREYDSRSGFSLGGVDGLPHV
ncbi:hypothetical protein DSM25558_3293 [Agrobacterium sp. DSM 25558]|nr:hypothetical protein DSM25558_3293 [Agrobacterium sp. DSM 25558]